MTESQMVTLIAQQLKLTRMDADAAVDAIFNSIASSLEAGRRLSCGVLAALGSKSDVSVLAVTPRRGRVWRWMPNGWCFSGLGRRCVRGWMADFG